MSKSDYLENAVLDHVLRGTAMTQPASLWLALGTAASDSSFTELTTPGTQGYARQSITFAAAASGSKASNNAQTFGPATADWANATHFAIFDASTGGNVLYYGSLTTPRDAGIDDSIEFASGAVTVTEA